jgi:transcriptional regulator with XRE-family HTH domain
MAEGTRKPFGELLRDHRAAAQLTQESLAARAGLSLDTVSALERGVHKSPRRLTILLLAEALGLGRAERDELVSATQPAAPPADSPPTGKRRRSSAAAWDLYVELTTRIAVAQLPQREGLLRETLTSLHALFGTVRVILKQYGPSTAFRTSADAHSVRSIAMLILDDVLRPFLSKWHPLLLDHENARPPGVSEAVHERAWTSNGELRADLSRVRNEMERWARLLAVMADVPHSTDLAPPLIQG